MSNTNTAIWDGVCKPPTTALKQIAGGRLKGMTDINPQWRYRAMTETFGPCGFGWGYEVDKLWTEKGVDAEVMAFAQVSLRIKSPAGAWSERIVGIGGSALIAIEKSGPKGSDECYKMAITDALSVAMKMLGVGADIYMGRWDGSKYKGGDDAPAASANSATISESLVMNHLAAIESADSIESLQKSFAAAYTSCKADQKATKMLMDAKDARKAVLSQKAEA